MSKNQARHVAVIGSGPAGLMAADVVSKAGYPVTIFDKKSGPGHKLLIAGSSGLNVTYDAPAERFHEYYRHRRDEIGRVIKAFPPSAWLKFIEQLGISTFLGTSGRYFIRGMKASPLLRAWLERLAAQGVTLQYRRECAGFDLEDGQIRLRFADGTEERFAAVCFCLGGGSYEPKEDPLRWPGIFIDKGLKFSPFQPSNVGYEVNWPEPLIKEAEGLPLKDVVLKTSLGEKQGDLVLTRYGLEGTPVYTIGTEGPAIVDLKPALTQGQLLERMSQDRENLLPIRRAKKRLNLSPAALALLFHMTPKEELTRADKLVARIKAFPVTLERPRPLAEAISSSGGLSWNELNSSLMLRQYPGTFVAGEMIDWDAPTGGFLIQACVSQGFVAGSGLVERLAHGG